tara:strand:- start:64 stop:456 length:393 start_codon:yes stop_codon:yes gene_type:complete
MKTQDKIQNLKALENKLGVKMEVTKARSTKLSQKQQIMAKVNDIVHKALCSEFSEFYKEIDTQAIVTNKEGKKTLVNVRGYRLLIPKSVELGDNETQEGFAIGKPTTYLDGINTNDCLYFTEIGNTKINK